MSDAEESRVAVLLPPGGGQVDVALLRRVQREDGTWWYRVALDVPARPTAPVDGQDYTDVPTDRASTAYVLQRLPGGEKDGQPRMMLHEADCWAASGTLTPTKDASYARGFVDHKWAEVCTACNPKP